RHAVPVDIPRCESRVHVASRPFARHGRIGVYRGASAFARLGEQRFVMLLCRLEGVGTDDRLPRVVAIASAPGPGRRVTVLDERGADRSKLILEAIGTRAPEVALIAPEGLVLVEVLGREDVDRQRGDAGRRRTALRHAD